VPLYEDFSDGNALDGMPVTWSTVPEGFTVGTSISIQDGNLFIENSGSAATGPDGVILRDVSTRAQTGLLSGSAIGLSSRYNQGDPFDNYFFQLNSSGRVILGIGTPSSDEIVLDSHWTDLRPTEEDVLLQFDAIGDNLTAWAWRPGEPRPSEPVLSATDDKIDSGQLAIYTIGPSAHGVFRFVQVDTQSISDSQKTLLQAGDADQDLDFDQLDLVKVQQAGKYLTSEPATWGEGDWNGAPGGYPGNPPQGDGVFNQLDVVAAQQAGLYLTGRYTSLAPTVTDAQPLFSVPVPEPNSLILLALGVLALFHVSRCKKWW
jgi:hypothetical protein